MTERRVPKRKAAEAALEAISRWKKNEKEDDEDDLVEPGLDCDGTVSLPYEIFLSILELLPKRELVHCASLVSRDWFVASQNPLLWPALESDIWKKHKPPSKIFTMCRFIRFLQRPQFARLKKLEPPPILFRTMYRSVFDRIGKALPHLEDFDISGRASPGLLLGVRPYAGELHRVPALFPRLKKLTMDVSTYEQQDLLQLIENMGDRLVELQLVSRFEDDDTCCSSNEVLKAIGQNCPKLETLRYMDCICPSETNLITIEGIVAVLEGCPEMKHLELRSVQVEALDQVGDILQKGYHVLSLKMHSWQFI